MTVLHVLKFLFTNGAIASAVVVAAPTSALAACAGAWDLSGHWRFTHSNGYVVDLELAQGSGVITGSAEFTVVPPPRLVPGIGARFTWGDVGPVEGIVTGDIVTFSIPWRSGAIGEYSGTVHETGFVDGLTYDRLSPANAASWFSDRPAVCAAAASSKPVDPDDPKKLVPRGADKPVDPADPKKLVPRSAGRPQSLVATVTSDVDLYDAPGGGGAVIGILERGAEVSAACLDDGWCAVNGTEPGKNGWVWGEFLGF